MLRESSCVGEPGDFKPLILDSRNRLYLHRYCQYEKEVAEYISARIRENNEVKQDKSELQKNCNCILMKIPKVKQTGKKSPPLPETISVLRQWILSGSN